MTISIGTTSKRVNSTSQSYTVATNSLDVKLKEPCSMRAPVFQVNKSQVPSGHFYNYLQWSTWYYYITDIIYLSNDIVEIHTKLDVLATFRSAIHDGYGYVLFGDSSHCINYKDDERFGPDHKLDWGAGQGPTDSATMGLDASNGSVVMTVQTSKAFSAYSGIVTYAMSPGVFLRVLKGFSGVVNSDIAQWSSTDILDIIRNYATRLLTGGVQALDNIVSATFVPIPLSLFNNIKLGSYNYIGLGPYEIMLDSGDTVYTIMPDATASSGQQMSLGRPLVNQSCPWLNSPKYCSVKITHPCGYAEINDNSLLETNNFYLYWAINYASGEYTIRATSENSKDSDTITVLKGCVGIDVLTWKPNSNSSYEANLHNRLLSNLMPGFYSAGSNGPSESGKSLGESWTGLSLLTTGKDIFVDVEYYQPSIFDANNTTMYEAFCDRYGYPCGQYYKLGNNSGFLIARDVSIAVENATDADMEYINNVINSGIYIE